MLNAKRKRIDIISVMTRDSFYPDEDNFGNYYWNYHIRQTGLGLMLQRNLRAARYNRFVRRWQALLRQILGAVRSARANRLA